MNYGPSLDVLKTISCKGIMDLALDGEFLCFGGTDRLYVADIADPFNPEIISECFFRGECRQLTRHGSLVLMTAREQGLLIFNVQDPWHPSLLGHYDTIELATGVCTDGNLLFIAQRQYGVEIVDISNPATPRHLCRIKTGEAQSVDARDGYLYVGDWGTCELTTIDVRNPRQPRIVAQNKLGGFGDGVCVEGDYVYAATGHHARNLGRPVTEADEGFGMGHGLEIYQLDRPDAPRFISRFSFPKLYHRVKYDMWGVSVSGGYACCADTFNGVFLLDIRDPANPLPLGHYQTLTGSVIPGDNCLYAACADSGLLVLKAEGVTRLPANRPTWPEPAITPVPVPVQDQPPELDAGYRIFQPGGQVWAVSFIGEYAFIAAGMAGLIVARLWPQVEVLDTIRTNDLALYVDTCGDRLLLSEGNGGLTIWEHTGDGRLKRLGRYSAENLYPIRQAKFFAGGRYAIVQAKYDFVILDLADPTRPHKVAQDTMLIVYWDQIGTGGIEDRYACVFDHPNGLRWIDFDQEGDRMVTGVHLTRKFSLTSGAAAYQNRMLAVYRGGYRIAGPMAEDLEAQPLITHGGKIDGKPRIFGHYLTVANRITAEVEIIDIADLEKPVLLDAFRTAGTPAGVVIHEGSLLIPDGYHGLLIKDDYLPGQPINI